MEQIHINRLLTSRCALLEIQTIVIQMIAIQIDSDSDENEDSDNSMEEDDQPFSLNTGRSWDTDSDDGFSDLGTFLWPMMVLISMRRGDDGSGSDGFDIDDDSFDDDGVDVVAKNTFLTMRMIRSNAVLVQ